MNCLCSAQDKAKNTFGKVSPADFSNPGKSSIVDSNTNAILLSDEGTLHYIGSKTGWFSHVLIRQTRIKILNKRALTGDEDVSRVSVRLYGQGDHLEKLTKVEGATYNLENGQIVHTALSDKDIYYTKLDKEHTEVKFSLPGVKEGSIIEYTYTITSDYWHLLPPWQFQWHAYPCLHSQYQVEIPQTLSFIFVRQGVHPFSMDKGSAGNAAFKITQELTGSLAGSRDEFYSISTVKHTWTMTDVPAFGDESYLSTPENYVDRIEFQLAGTNNGETKEDVNNTWAKATESLLRREDFGGAIVQENIDVDTLADKIGLEAQTPLAQAKATFYFVSRHFTCTNHYNKFVKTNFHDVLKTNSGTVGDINLLLTAMLRRKGFTADPVLLSTREQGFNLYSYPMLGRLNYVIVRLKVEDRIYYLDAAHPELGFGQLAADCYNGHARIISNKDSGSVWFLSDSLKEAKTTMVLIAAAGKRMEGSWQSNLGKERSYQVRKTVQEKGQAAFFKDIQTSWGQDLEISNGGIDSLDQPENPIKVHYDFALKGDIGEPIIYINPVFGDGWHENPFKEADRKYPVEMPYATDELYIFTMAIPEGYVVDESPKSTRVALNTDQGSFEYLVQLSADQIQLRCRLKLNKAAFQPEDYSTLRDFFAYVVKKENEQIVLKKK